MVSAVDTACSDASQVLPGDAGWPHGYGTRLHLHLAPYAVFSPVLLSMVDSDEIISMNVYLSINLVMIRDGSILLVFCAEVWNQG
jgi:hypothetical protein